MRLPFVSAATYNWAIRHAERLANERDRMEVQLERVRAESVRCFDRWETECARVAQLTDTIVAMKRENFVAEVPITNVPMSTDEADEYTVAEESARPALLKRKLGT